MYRGILLDADDTLFDFAAAEKAAISAFLADISLPAEAAPTYSRINDACWEEFEQRIITIDELRVKRFSEFFAHCGHSMSPKAAADIYEERLGEQTQLLPGALEAVRAIAEKLPIAIVTNGISCVQRARLAHSPIGQYISALIISGEVGAAKPDKIMIEAALDALNMPGETRVLMVGDSIRSDIHAAHNAGVDACWVNIKGAQRPKHPPIAYEISSVEFLPRVLGL